MKVIERLIELRHHGVHSVDKSSIVTAESRNETYSLKIQRYSPTDCFQLPTYNINKVKYYTQNNQ